MGLEREKLLLILRHQYFVSDMVLVPPSRAVRTYLFGNGYFVREESESEEVQGVSGQSGEYGLFQLEYEFGEVELWGVAGVSMIKLKGCTVLVTD